MYRTQQLIASEMRPFSAELPGHAEEVSEEDAPVVLIAPEHPLLMTPNRITARGFEGWIAPRGSKLFSSWSEPFPSLIETRDADHAPQRGVWLAVRVGEGHYAYVELAWHRQVPYGVAGAYRILTDVIARRPW